MNDLPATTRMTQEIVRDIFDYRLDGQLIHRRQIGRYANRPAIGQVAGTVSRGYRLVRVLGVLHRVHRLVYLWHHGTMPNEIDHMNGDGLDNRIENLRAVSRSENNWNRAGIKGYSWCAVMKKWRATIYVGNRQKIIGYFDSESEAAAAYLSEKAVAHAVAGRVANCYR